MKNMNTEAADRAAYARGKLVLYTEYQLFDHARAEETGATCDLAVCGCEVCEDELAARECATAEAGEPHNDNGGYR
jgi:hypothetical protein